MHPIPEASVVKHERGCPFYRPGPPTIQMVGDGPVQSPMEHLTPQGQPLTESSKQWLGSKTRQKIYPGCATPHG